MASSQEIFQAVLEIKDQIGEVKHEIGGLSAKIEAARMEREACETRCAAKLQAASNDRNEIRKLALQNKDALATRASRALGWLDVAKVVVPLLGLLVALRRLGVL